MAIVPNTTVFIFPGQGSQAIGMGKELAESFPVALHTFREADDILGFHLSHLAWEGPESELNDTLNTQPALMTHSVAALRVLQQEFPDLLPAFVAGHSMGELSALVAGGALDFIHALLLVRRRGELMKRAGEVSPGGMAAIIGLDMPVLEDLCIQASQDEEIVQVANDNCPGQVVISGASPALERAIELAQRAGARRAVKLAVSIAAHSPLMINAQEDFNLAVNQAPIQNPALAIIGNVTAAPLSSAQQVRADLQAQLTSRVRWTESIQYMASQNVSTYIEVGTGSVLGGLIKRIHREANCIPMGTPADLKRLQA